MTLTWSSASKIHRKLHSISYVSTKFVTRIECIQGTLKKGNSSFLCIFYSFIFSHQKRSLSYRNFAAFVWSRGRVIAIHLVMIV